MTRTRAGVDAVRNLERAIQIAGEDRGGEPVSDAVTDRHRSVEGVSHEQRTHRREHLVLSQLRAGVIQLDDVGAT